MICATKTKLNAGPHMDYPKLRVRFCGPDAGMVVLFTDPNTGTIVVLGDNNHVQPVGKHRTDWVSNTFADFGDIVTLRNA